MPDPKDTRIPDNTNKSSDLPPSARAQPADVERERYLVDPADGRRERRGDKPGRDPGEERRATAALRASAETMPLEEPAGRDAAAIRDLFSRLNHEHVFARLPHWLQNNTLRSAMPEILTAVASEILEHEKALALGEVARAYKTVDRGGNVREIVPGHEPRRGAARMPEPIPTTAALTPKAPPLSASPPAPVAPNGETKFAPNPRGPR